MSLYRDFSPYLGQFHGIAVKVPEMAAVVAVNAKKAGDARCTPGPFSFFTLLLAPE